MTNASRLQGENECQYKKKTNRNTCDISSTKRVKTRKFHVVIVQNNGKEMSQKSVLQVQSCFLLIKP